jgi:hypothetical protein
MLMFKKADIPQEMELGLNNPAKNAEGTSFI